MTMDKYKYTCCICKKEFNGWGNNPWPVNNDVNARCCDDCNNYVILERLAMLKRKKPNKG